MLAGSALSCQRHDRILFRNLSFSLQPGQVLQIQGNNGSGKTTLLRILCGISDRFEGQISWYGEPVLRCREEFLASLLYLGHRVGVSKALTPLENLHWYCRLHGVARAADGLLAALDAAGLGGYEHAPCYTLSAGQQQRAALARLLVSDARLWLLDEPFTTLDSSGVAWLEQLISQQAQQGGAVLVTTHHQLAMPGLHTLLLDEAAPVSA